MDAVISGFLGVVHILAFERIWLMYSALCHVGYIMQRKLCGGLNRTSEWLQESAVACSPHDNLWDDQHEVAHTSGYWAVHIKVTGA